MNWSEIPAAAWDPEAKGLRFERVTIEGAAASATLHVVRGGSGAGPTILVCGGTHGDEFEGQMVALELARSLDALTIDGRLIVLPLHHESACRAGTRLSPVDGADLNRVFGGGPRAGDGPTTALARFVESRVLPAADVVLDLHSGGEDHIFVLSSNLQAAPGGEEHARQRPALLAFDAPYAIVFDEAGDKAMPHAGTLEGAARAAGKRAISSELGGGGHLTPGSLAVGRQGLVNLLHHFGVVRSPLATAWRDSRSRELALSRPEQHLAAPTAGWFRPEVRLGDAVRACDRVGTLVRDGDPFAEPLPVEAETEGVVVALAHRTRQRAGDVLAFVAAELADDWRAG